MHENNVSSFRDILYHNHSTICLSNPFSPRPTDSSDINIASFPLDHNIHQISKTRVDEFDHVAIGVGEMSPVDLSILIKSTKSKLMKYIYSQCDFLSSE